MFLDDGKDRGDRHGDAQNHVEGDEEFVQFALANEGSGVVPAAKITQLQIGFRYHFELCLTRSINRWKPVR